MCVTYPISQGVVGGTVCFGVCVCVFQTRHAGRHNTAVKLFRLEWDFIIVALPEP